MIEVLTPIRKIRVEQAYIPEARAVLPDGDTCVVVDAFGRLFTVSLSTAEVVRVESGSPGVSALSVTPDGRLMATSVHAFGEYGIRIWDVASWTVATELVGHSHPILAVTAAGQVVVTAAGDGARVWDLNEGSCRFTLPGTEEVRWVAVTHDGRHVVTMSWDRSIVLWDLWTGVPVRTLRDADSRVPAFSSPASDRGVWIRTVLADSARDRVLAADGQLCVGGLGGRRPLADWQTIPRHDRVNMIPGKDLVHTCVAALNPADGIVAVDYGGRIYLLDQGGQPLAVMGEEPGPGWIPVSTMTFAPDGRLVSSFPGAFAAVEVWPALSELTG
ncbi:WD40 repeat domain-containing protein [Actinoallomurus sp. CA-150999]|uniref:WD40 repeat domain-containing protein n=1 Tax=Actinoallomurus sp. CA-150999 TaxID=3239887 RepID=UPI003D8BEFAF